MLTSSRIKIFLVALLLVSAGSFAVTASANHSWGGYHWARTANPLNLKLADNLSASWDPYLATASAEWSLSTVLDTTIVAGQANPKNCRATLGRVEVCNSKYGNNGWLGIASIWANGTHITQGTVKMNDTYFATAKYNTPAWKNLVVCQEIAHTFGLDHQDEIFTNANLGTCMDYTNDPDGTVYGQLSNEYPNQHDYDGLETIYAHVDTTNTAFSKTAASANNLDTNEPSAWGKEVKKSHDGHSSLYERDLGKGEKVFTFVVWAQ